MKQDNSEYAPGQVWLYQSRPGEEKSELLIYKVDALPDLLIYHIAIRGLRLKSSSDPQAPLIDELPHIPVSRETLDASLTVFLETLNPVPKVNGGYEMWKKEFDEGNAGFFAVPVAEILEIAQENILSNNS